METETAYLRSQLVEQAFRITLLMSLFNLNKWLITEMVQSRLLTSQEAAMLLIQDLAAMKEMAVTQETDKMPHLYPFLRTKVAFQSLSASSSRLNHSSK